MTSELTDSRRFDPEEAVTALFEPLQVRSLALPNRIVMSPMTREHSPGGIPGADVAAYYRRRAEGGSGLVITEGVAIDHPTAVDSPKVHACTAKRHSWAGATWSTKFTKRAAGSSRSSGTSGHSGAR